MRTDTTVPSKPAESHHNSLVPPHRRARVILALIFFCVSLFFLNHVSTL